jgi:hypothetical protein
LLAEAFVEPLQRHASELSKERLRELAIEFEPRIVMSFQNLAAAVLREHFTHDELRELIRFYETPLGRKYARVYPQWKDKIAAGDAERQKVAEDLLARLRPHGAANQPTNP